MQLFVTSFAQVFWKETASIVEGGEGNILIVLPEFMLESPSTFFNLVDKQLSVPLTEWASGEKKVTRPAPSRDRFIKPLVVLRPQPCLLTLHWRTRAPFAAAPLCLPPLGG